MTSSYRLKGEFIESCDCRVICPCWVDDNPDEEHCAGMFAWHFDDESHIDGHAVAGHAVVSVTVHGDGRKGGKSESVIFYDAELGGMVGPLLVRALSGKAGGPLEQLALTTGEVVEVIAAQIDMVPDPEGWQVIVRGQHTEYVRATGKPLFFDDRDTALKLTNTALSAELGIGDEPVQASRADLVRVDAAGLRGGPIAVEGRSGMTGRFDYRHVVAVYTAEDEDNTIDPGEADLGNEQ